MGRHVVSDVVVIFAQEQSCDKRESSRLSGRLEELRSLLLQRPGIFDVSKLSAASINERVAAYEPQAAALGAYLLMSLPPATPDRAVTDNWRVGFTDRDETRFAVSDPFKEES
jgi:hypothetical protein